MTGDSRFDELRETLLGLFRRGSDSGLDDGTFNELALRVFRFQCRRVPGYGAFMERRGVVPQRIRRWEEIPFLPTRAFKVAPLLSGDPALAQAVFRTSGTTRGREERGVHYVRDLSLYRGALLPSFRTHLVPEGGMFPVLALMPSPEEAPDSSLSFMMGEVMAGLGGGNGGFFVDPSGGVRTEPLRGALDRVVEEGDPVIVAGTAFAFVHWLESTRREGRRYSLPDGSRIMETGGYKGRSRALSREDLYEGLGEVLGVPAGRIVNEYGMTELLSQFYDAVVPVEASSPDPGAGPVPGGEAAGGGTAGNGEPRLGERYHRGPAWVRTLVLDPLTLAPLPPGEVGILAHLDLANVGSVSAVLTEDLGRSVPGGFQLQGRAPGAEPRGCSLAMELFLAGNGG